METSSERQAPQGERLALIEDEHSVTGVVQAAMANTTNPRLRFIMDSLVRHLHGFLSEVRLSDEEFELALGISPAWAMRPMPNTTRLSWLPTCWGCRRW